MAGEKLGFKELFDFSDTTDIKDAIEKIGTLADTVTSLRETSQKAAAGYSSALDDIGKSAARLDNEMEGLDATLEAHQKLIVSSAAKAEQLLASQQANIKAREVERAQTEKLKAAEDALAKSKDDLSKINTKEAGSLATLRGQLEKAVSDVKGMGDATDGLVKKAALDRVAELTKQVTTADAAFKNANKVVNTAAGSYDALVIQVAAAKKELKGMEGGIGSNSEKFRELQKTVKEGNEKLKDFDKAVGDSSHSTEGQELALEKLDEATGGAVSGVKSLAAGFKALLLNPIGIFILLIVGALESLNEYFNGSSEGQDNFNKLALQGKAIVETFAHFLEVFGKILFDTFSEPGKVVDALFEKIKPLTGALNSAFHDPLQAIEDLGKAIVDNIISRFEAIGVAGHAIAKIFKGDLKQGFKELADAGIQATTGIKNGTDKIVAAYDAVAGVIKGATDAFAEELARRQTLNEKFANLENQLKKDRIADIVDDAKTELDVYRQLNKAQDKLRFSANERFQAEKAAGKLLEDQLNGDIKLAEDEIKLQELQIQRTGENYDNLQKLAELQAKRIGLESAFEKAFKKRQATERQLLDEAEKDRTDKIKREEDAQRLLNDTITKAHIESNKEIIADDRTNLEDKISLLSDNADYERDLAKSNLETQLSAAKEAGIARVNVDADVLDKIYSQQGASAEKINADRRAAAEEALKGDQAYIDTVTKLNEDFKNETIKINEETVNATADNVFKQWSKDYNAFLDEVDTQAAEKKLSLDDAFAKGEISLKEFNKARADIQNSADEEALNQQLAYLTKQQRQLAASGVETSALEKAIAETELAIADGKNQKLLEGQAALDQKLKELRQVAIDTALTIIDNQNAAEDMKRDEKLAKLQANYETEIQMAGDNDAAKTALTNAYNAEKDKVDKEQRAADRKRAIFQKAVAVVEIAINTAKGIGLALGSYIPPVSFALAAVVGVIGALQIAAVLSKPVPAFAEGTDDSPGGWAIVNDGKGQEAVTDSKGTRLIDSKGPALINLERHSIVHTAEEVAIMKAGDRMIAGFDDDTQKMRHVKIEVDTSTMTAVLGSKLDRMVEMMSKQKAPVINPAGIAREVAKGIDLAAFESAHYK